MIWNFHTCEATGISKNHADRRAAKKIIEEPTYGAKSPVQALTERKLKATYVLENKTEGQLIQKVSFFQV